MFINATMTQHLAEQRIADLHREAVQPRLSLAARQRTLRTARALLSRHSR